MIDDDLGKLLMRAGIASTEYWRDVWFRGCRLQANQLLCPDLTTAEALDRMFLPQLKSVMADIEIRVLPEGKPVATSWKPRKSAFKKGMAPPGWEPDLLD